MPKVSVIIPIYNVEQYIERCARSLFEQTLEDIEYVFVNDCTPDSSMTVLESVIEKYPNRKRSVRILTHTVNQGLPAARKTGFDTALGDFIIFCDSDDWMEHEMIATLYNTAVLSSADMVVCGYNEATETEKKPIHIKTDGTDIFRDIISDRIQGYTWNKMVKRRVYDNSIVWPHSNLLEDTLLVIQLAYYCQKFSVVDEPLYNYFQNRNSICLSEFSETKYFQARENLEAAIDFLKSKNLEQKYSKEIASLKIRITRAATLLPQALFRKYNKTIDFNLLASKYCPTAEKLGYLTKLLGIHGISKIFK